MSNERSRFDPRFDPAFQRGYDGEIAPVLTERVSEPVPVEAVPSEEAVTEPQVIEVVEVDARGRRINPYLIVLGALSVALIAGGLYLISTLRELFESSQTSSDFDYVILQVLLYGAPLIVVMGIATAIGMIFLAAVRWER